MIDSVVQIDKYKLAIEAIVAEGGFGYVYKVRDIDTNNLFALKKINSSDLETQNEIENEIDILKRLQKHPHIMEFISHIKLDQNQPAGEQHQQQQQTSGNSSSGASNNSGSCNNINNTNNNKSTSTSNRSNYRATYFILTEFCDRGTLNQLNLPIQALEKSCRIIYQISLALKHMHKLSIIHRDIKAENILFDKNGYVKLCDFGSSTKNCHNPTIEWTPLERSTVEEEMQRHTTPLYRPPEILETYLHYPINCALDIWALGCLIYYMRFGQHAFPDSGKLRIVNCCYTIPKDVSKDDPLVTIIRQCLVPDPTERISIQTLIDTLELNFQDMDLKASVVPFKPSASSREERSLLDVSQPQPQPQNQQPQTATPTATTTVAPTTTTTKPKTLQPRSSTSVEDMTATEGEKSSKQETSENHQEVANSDPAEKDANPIDTMTDNTSAEDTLIDLANSSSSSCGTEKSTSIPRPVRTNTADKDPALKAGLFSDLIQPTKSSINNIDALLNMGGPNPNDAISDHKVLSPKKASYTSSGLGGCNQKKDVFDDLLDSFGSSFTTSYGPASNQAGNLWDDSAYDGFVIDPKCKINKWKESRRGNIRALLGSLHLVLSEDFRWKPIGMHQLVTDADVKKVYRLACLSIHPDKMMNSDEETKDIAKMIFMELNDAWSKFDGK